MKLPAESPAVQVVPNAANWTACAGRGMPRAMASTRSAASGVAREWAKNGLQRDGVRRGGVQWGSVVMGSCPDRDPSVTQSPPIRQRKTLAMRGPERTALASDPPHAIFRRHDHPP